MARTRLTSAIVLFGILGLTACRAPMVAPVLTGNLPVVNSQSAISASADLLLGERALPPASAFKTIECVVTKLLPLDNQGLKHQNFIVRQTKPEAGVIMECNNSITHGSMVKPLNVGDALTIKGTIYVNDKPRKPGIHWTHHSENPEIGGWIKTADGKIFQ